MVKMAQTAKQKFIAEYAAERGGIVSTAEAEKAWQEQREPEWKVIEGPPGGVTPPPAPPIKPTPPTPTVTKTVTPPRQEPAWQVVEGPPGGVTPPPTPPTTPQPKPETIYPGWVEVMAESSGQPPQAILETYEQYGRALGPGADIPGVEETEAERGFYSQISQRGAATFETGAVLAALMGGEKTYPEIIAELKAKGFEIDMAELGTHLEILEREALISPIEIRPQKISDIEKASKAIAEMMPKIEAGQVERQAQLKRLSEIYKLRPAEISEAERAARAGYYEEAPKMEFRAGWKRGEEPPGIIYSELPVKEKTISEQLEHWVAGGTGTIRFDRPLTDPVKREFEHKVLQAEIKPGEIEPAWAKVRYSDLGGVPFLGDFVTDFVHTLEPIGRSIAELSQSQRIAQEREGVTITPEGVQIPAPAAAFKYEPTPFGTIGGLAASFGFGLMAGRAFGTISEFVIRPGWSKASETVQAGVWQHFEKTKGFGEASRRGITTAIGKDPMETAKFISRGKGVASKIETVGALGLFGYVGYTEYEKISGMIKAGAPQTEIARTLVKDVVFIAGIGRSYTQGFRAAGGFKKTIRRRLGLGRVAPDIKYKYTPAEMEAIIGKGGLIPDEAAFSPEVLAREQLYPTYSGAKGDWVSQYARRATARKQTLEPYLGKAPPGKDPWLTGTQRKFWNPNQHLALDFDSYLKGQFGLFEPSWLRLTGGRSLVESIADRGLWQTLKNLGHPRQSPRVYQVYAKTDVLPQRGLPQMQAYLDAQVGSETAYLSLYKSEMEALIPNLSQHQFMAARAWVKVEGTPIPIDQYRLTPSRAAVTKYRPDLGAPAPSRVITTDSGRVLEMDKILSRLRQITPQTKPAQPSSYVAESLIIMPSFMPSRVSVREPSSSEYSASSYLSSSAPSYSALKYSMLSSSAIKSSSLSRSSSALSSAASSASSSYLSSAAISSSSLGKISGGGGKITVPQIPYLREGPKVKQFKRDKKGERWRRGKKVFELGNPLQIFMGITPKRKTFRVEFYQKKLTGGKKR